MLKAGELRERLTPEQPLDTPDGSGGALRVWQALAPVRARVTPLAAAAHRSAERDGELRRFEVVLRTGPDIRAGMRLLWRGRVLDVVATRPLDASERFLVLDCEERP